MSDFENYRRYIKPELADLLKAAGLDRVYTRALGDKLYYQKDGQEHEVLDLVGGFGASLFGHNHPEIVKRAKAALENQLPFNCQGSIRPKAAKLASKLHEMAHKASGKEYVITFANTGTEAVEAAMKHAEMERRYAITAIDKELVQKSHLIRRCLRSLECSIDEALFKTAAAHFGVAHIGGIDELLFEIHRQALNKIEKPPVFLAIEGAFHGKTSGAVQMTHRSEYQAPWRDFGPKVRFVKRWDEKELKSFISDETSFFWDVALKNNELVLVERLWVNVAGIFIEPILGEGGIHSAPKTFLESVRKSADMYNIPLIFDEIQSGMGRTGTFWAAEKHGIHADYVTMSKSLGAGLAKTSALLVDKNRYLKEFGYVHTSTFAEDDYSSEVALAGLEMLSEDDDQLMKQCGELGQAFIDKLKEVQQSHPDCITDVRGDGLMIGVEITVSEGCKSPLMKVLSNQDLLGYIVSGWLLNEKNIRVAPTISSRATLRIEPSAYLTLLEMDRFCKALNELCDILNGGDAYKLLRYSVHKEGVDTQKILEYGGPTIFTPTKAGTAKVGFLAHFLEPDDISQWDPTLKGFSVDDCQAFLERTQGVIEPFVADTLEIESLIGNRVHCTVFAVPFSPEQVVQSMRAGESDWALDLVFQGVEKARQHGCSILGFGGYTSIVTNNCRLVVPSDLTVTSGNSLTSVAALDALHMAAKRIGIEHKTLGIVGAVGNIGQVLAEVASDNVDEIVLVGSGRGRNRLLKAARALSKKIILRAKSSANKSGVVRKFFERGFTDIEKIETWDFENNQDLPIRVANALDALVDCNLIVSTTNSAKPVLKAEHIHKANPVVVSDVAVPTDLTEGIENERLNAIFLRGGIVSAPMGQKVDVAGIRLPPGQVHGCLGETLLMGLGGIGENFSYGALSARGIRRVRSMAKEHGFAVNENVLGLSKD